MLPREHGQHHEQRAVKSFNQPITSRMIWSRTCFMSPQQEAQFLHKMILKLAALIWVDDRRHTEPAYNQLEKRVSNGHRRLILQSTSLSPSRETVHN